MSTSSKNASPGIVANGRSRCLHTPEFWEERESVVRGVWEEYRKDAHSRGWATRALLWFSAHREARRRVKRLVADWAPEEALY